MMDSNKSPEELVKARAAYYKHIILATFRSIGVPTKKLVFVLGSDYQLDRPYVMDEHRMRAIVSDHEARRAGTEVVKQAEHSKLSSLSYPGMQALDEQHLGVDVQFGGVDQVSRRTAARCAAAERETEREREREVDRTALTELRMHSFTPPLSAASSCSQRRSCRS